MGYRDNLEEKEELRSFRKRERWFFIIFFLMVSTIIVLLLGNLTGANIKWSEYWLRVPFLGSTTRLDIILVIVLYFYWVWISGTRFKILSKAYAKIPYIGKTISKGGKDKELEAFFYPEVSFTDGIKRGKGYHFFKWSKDDSEITVDNLFDFGKYSHSKELTGTERIQALFRDKEQEELRRTVKIGREKQAEKAKRALESIEKAHGNKPTENQKLLYHDLFLMLEGIYASYANDFGDKIFIGKHLKTPVRLYAVKKNDTYRITKIDIDESIDVFRKGKVYFSLKMVQDTAINLTKLYILFLEKRMGRGRFSEIAPERMERFEMFFKFFIVRRLLLNYSNIPSGWLCVKIEDYTTRAIASNIDREMIIDINDNNNGTNPAYNSDVEASQFLFTYWAFMYSSQMKKAMEGIEFVFNTTKEVKEINARKIAAEAMREIEKEHNETYNSIKDDDLVLLPPKEEE